MYFFIGMNVRAHCTQRLRAEFRLLLTGTPLQNNIQELWSLLNFIEPSKYTTFDAFQAEFGTLRSAEQVEALQKSILPHLLRRVKEDVEHSIPKKLETVIDVELTVLQVCLSSPSAATMHVCAAIQLLIVLQKQYYRAIFERNRMFLYKGCDKSNLPGLINVGTLPMSVFACIAKFSISAHSSPVLRRNATSKSLQQSVFDQWRGREGCDCEVLRKRARSDGGVQRQDGAAQ